MQANATNSLDLRKYKQMQAIANKCEQKSEQLQANASKCEQQFEQLQEKTREFKPGVIPALG